MVQIKIDKELDDIRFTTIITKKGEGRITVALPHVKKFDMDLSDQEVEHAKSLVFRASSGAITFGESEPGDILGEMIRQVGVLEEQAEIIGRLTDERDTAARAAANSNEELNLVRSELEEVRNRLRESVNETNKLRDGMKDHLGKLSAFETDISKLNAENDRLREELLKTSREQPTNPEAVKATETVKTG